jgi:hypothetical protein
VIGPWAQASASRKLQSTVKQARDLLVRVEVRSRSARLKRQQAQRWKLGLRVAGNVVAREATDIAQPLCPR